MRILNPNWPTNKRIKAFTSLKHCSLSDLKLPSQYYLINQKHGANIVSASGNNNDLPIADGSYTTDTNLACVIKTADCLPLLITNINGDFVAALHCGWRSLALGIIDNFFKIISSCKLPITLKQLLFYLGPAIGPEKFEVGAEVLDRFINKHTAYQAAFSKITSSTTQLQSSKDQYLANIYQLAIINLQQYDISDQQIFSEYWCTYTQDNLFYSYRRGCGEADRMYSVIWRE